MLMTKQMTRKRINRELEDCQKEDMGEMTLHPEEDLYNWKVFNFCAAI